MLCYYISCLPQIFPFGFIGVDIFFVISGYLITNIIKQDNFSLKSFYQHRILRIIPPLLIIIFSALVLGWFLLTPEEYQRFGAHLRSSSFFFSNFHLLGEEGYFNVANTQKPLLHLWSLAIEEQFYIIYPILLILFSRFSKRIFGILIIFGISLTASCYTDNPAYRFYSPLSRAFELSWGALATIAPPNIKINNIASILGILLILSALPFVANHYAWPNKWALMLCMGVSLILWSRCLFIHPILTNKFIVFIGIISYELYLWHWLLLSIGFITTGGDLLTSTKIFLILIALMLSIICFLIIERPIRIKFRGNWKVASILLICLAISGFAGHMLTNTGGFPSRINEKYLDITPFTTLGNKYFPDWQKFTNTNIIVLEDNPDKLDIAIIGDSHANHLFYGFHEILRGEKKVGIFSASCQAPYLGIATATEHFHNIRKNNYKLMEQSYNTITENSNIETIILAHNPECSFNDIYDVNDLNNTDKDEILEKSMRESLDLLKKFKKKVILLLDNPHIDFDPGAFKNRPFNLNNLDLNQYFPEAKDEALK